MYEIQVTGANGKTNYLTAKTQKSALRIAKSAVKAGALEVLVINDNVPMGCLDYTVFEYVA